MESWSMSVSRIYLLARHYIIFLKKTKVIFVHLVVHAMKLGVMFLIERAKECEVIVL